jgi:hypothetical protein
MHQQYAKAFQIVSVDVEEKDNTRWMHVMVFVGNKATSQKLITSASSKTGIIKYFTTDTNGHRVADPITTKPIERTLHSDNIRIYCILPVSVANSYIVPDWSSETPLKTIL